MSSQENLVRVGRIGAAYGVRGWLKIASETEPVENILRYAPWSLQARGEFREYVLESGRRLNHGVIAKLKDVDDREAAQRLSGAIILAPAVRFTRLPEGEYYWAQLIGLSARSVDGRTIGTVAGLIETGTHDVLVIAGTGGKEVLVPYVMDRYVKRIDLGKSTIELDWEPGA